MIQSSYLHLGSVLDIKTKYNGNCPKKMKDVNMFCYDVLEDWKYFSNK